MDKIALKCVRIEFVDRSLETPYNELLGGLTEDTLVSYEFAHQRTFSLKRYFRPDGSGDMLCLVLVGSDATDPNAKFDIADLSFKRNSISAAVLPRCFYMGNTFSDFEKGQEVVMANTIGVGTASMFGDFTNSSMTIEYGKIVSVTEDTIRVELDDIPGQIETVTNPILIAPKLDVIPYLAT